jgi:hypothetical protein
MRPKRRAAPHPVGSADHLLPLRERRKTRTPSLAKREKVAAGWLPDEGQRNPLTKFRERGEEPDFNFC